MKFYRPIKDLKEEISKPIQFVAVLAFGAFMIASIALIMAMGKE